MESESENRPLLHSFEGETWRSSLRKRCLRIPSEVTITGIILGLFLMVVTLLIVFENLETTNKDELTLSDNLLGSPMKYNKKALDTSWQDKKNSMKTRKKFKDQKWSKVNDGWKKIRDPSGMRSTFETEDLHENRKEKVEITDLPIGIDEYGKEVDDSLETFIKNEWHIANAAKNFDAHKSELKYLLENSNAKWKNVDDGWKILSDQGWKDKEIKEALLAVLKEKEFSEKEDSVPQSPMNLDDIWNKINDNWKEKIDKGHEEPEKQLNINPEWKNKMNLLQSSKVSKNKLKKVDDDWKTLSDQDWKNGQIIEALLKDLKEKESFTKQENGLKSQSKLDDLWDKINNKWDELLHKEEKDQEIQKSTSNEWENQISAVNSPKALLKKMKKADPGWKKLIDQGWKDKDIEKAIIEAWKEKENEEEDLLQSSMNLKPLWEKTVDMLKTLIKKDSTKEESQKNFNEEWVDKINVLQSPKSSIKLNNDGDWKILLKQGWKNEEIKEALIKIKMVIENIQNERNNSRRTKPPRRSKGTTSYPLQSEIPLDKIDLESSDERLKMLSVQGWSDKDMEEALYEAWKDGNKMMQSSMSYNSMKWKKVNDGYKKIFNKSVGVPTRCPIPKSHLLGSPMSAPEVNCALIAEEVRRKLGKCIDMSFMPKACKPSWRTKCFSTYKYRKMDGTCNNEIHPTWGKSGTPFVRMMAPDYGDSVSTLRTAKNGEPLPNPRFLSRKLYSKRMKPDSDNSIIFLYFGLIIDHDMVETAVNSDVIPCCEETPQNRRPKECLQIDVPNNDPFYGPRNVTCLNLVRSIPVTGECAGRREQLNKATSFLDGSAVYGSIIKQAKQLRTFSRGQLRTQLINNTPFMSAAEGSGYSCGTPKEPLKCFEAGDSRVNMIVELTAMHTLWYREHNKIATKLHELNPKWTDEMLYQEARKILIGELQHITYNEFLSLLLGEKAIKKYQLSIDPSKNYDGYDNTVNPSVFNVFGAAAFRFGHSIVPDMQNLLGSEHSILGKVPLHETFFNAEILYHDGLDMLLRGAALQRAQTVDSYITSEVREHLFQPANLDYGHDLAAVGIQRGRDHGLPSYTKWRLACGLPEVKTWEDLYKIMDKERANTFKSVYQSVEDIDLIPGALAELHETGSLLGPTYTCLIGRQFKKTRKGDRFWYEMQNGIGSFTKGQLDQIYKSSMSRIICDNSDEIKTIQRNAFKVPSDHNPLLDCSAIPKVDLSEWSVKS